MTFALKELTRLLATATTTVGAVVSVEGAEVRVATARGAVLARTLETLKTGDRVLLKNGIASRAPVASKIFPV